MWELQQHTDITVTDDDDDDDDGSATFVRSAHAPFSLTFSTYSISPTSLLIATANICLTSTIYTSFSLFPFPHSISVCLWTLYHIIWIWYGFFACMWHATKLSPKFVNTFSLSISLSLLSSVYLSPSQTSITKRKYDKENRQMISLYGSSCLKCYLMLFYWFRGGCLKTILL